MSRSGRAGERTSPGTSDEERGTISPRIGFLGPDPALKGAVRNYFWVGDLSARVTRVVVPDGCVDLLFNLAEHRGTASGQVEPGAGVIGALSAPLRVVRPPHAPVVGVTFAPGAARRILGVPVHQFRDRLVGLEDFCGPPARQLLAQLREADSTAEHVRLLDSFLLQRLGPDSTPPAISLAFQRIQSASGRVTVRTLTRELQVSERRLERLFLDHLGLSPKGLSRIVRFQAVLSAMKRGPVDSWGALAHDHGYADQAHLIRDFRSLSGTTPGGYTRERGLSGSFNTPLTG